MRRFVFALVALAVLPTTSGWSQDAASTAAATQATAQTPTTDDDVVPAAELEAAVADLENTHAQNYNTLASIIDKVPASARPAIEQAMESSKRGYQQARTNRERTIAMRQAKASARLAKGHGGQGKGQVQGQGQVQVQGQGQGQVQGQPGGKFGGRSTQAGQGQPEMRTARATEPQGGRPATAGPQNGGQVGGPSSNQGGQARGPGAAQGPVRR